MRKLVNWRRSTPVDLSTTILPSLFISFSPLKATLPSALPSATVPCFFLTSTTSSSSVSCVWRERVANSRDLPLASELRDLPPSSLLSSSSSSKCPLQEALEGPICLQPPRPISFLLSQTGEVEEDEGGGDVTSISFKSTFTFSSFSFKSTFTPGTFLSSSSTTMMISSPFSSSSSFSSGCLALPARVTLANLLILESNLSKKLLVLSSFLSLHLSRLPSPICCCWLCGRGGETEFRFVEG